MKKTPFFLIMMFLSLFAMRLYALSVSVNDKYAIAPNGDGGLRIMAVDNVDNNEDDGDDGGIQSISAFVSNLGTNGLNIHPGQSANQVLVSFSSQGGQSIMLAVTASSTNSGIFQDFHINDVIAHLTQHLTPPESQNDNDHLAAFTVLNAISQPAVLDQINLAFVNATLGGDAIPVPGELIIDGDAVQVGGMTTQMVDSGVNLQITVSGGAGDNAGNAGNAGNVPTVTVTQLTAEDINSPQDALTTSLKEWMMHKARQWCSREGWSRWLGSIWQKYGWQQGSAEHEKHGKQRAVYAGYSVGNDACHDEGPDGAAAARLFLSMAILMTKSLAKGN